MKKLNLPGRPLNLLCRLRSGIFVFLFLFGNSALAGGGGQNLVLVVNPNDENQLRIANEYQRLRNIPDCNIVLIETRKINHTFFRAAEPKALPYVDFYLQPIADRIAAQGLSNQVDYITCLGQPFIMNGLVDGETIAISHDYATTYLDELTSGTTPETISEYASTIRYVTPENYTNALLNTALVHTNDGMYVGNTLAFTGLGGNSPGDAIATLQRTVPADGTKPDGTIYFEENDNVRSNTREPQWPATQSNLTLRGISYTEESDVSGGTPLNRTDVRGAVIGKPRYTIPNASTYLPGSWADCLTSAGANFDALGPSAQTKCTELIRVGVAGSSGTIIEPFAITARFPHSYIYLYLADGSTIGEAFYQSVKTPLLQEMLGDPLSQPYADIPNVTVTSGPDHGASVTGQVDFAVSASLLNATRAAGISRIELYLDGKAADSIVGSNGVFTIDTSLLEDGWREVRFVAINNTAVASQGYTLQSIQVNNSGRSVSGGGDLDAGTALSIHVPITTTAGTGSVTRIELRHFSRNLGELHASSGSIDLDVSRLAYGKNRITPVAIFSDGAEVQGQPIRIQRSPDYLPGTPPILSIKRQHGIRGEYFYGQGGNSINGSTFNEPADLTVNHTVLNIGVHDGSSATMTHLSSSVFGIFPHPVGSKTNIALVDHLSARYSGSFEVETEGEYQFFFYRSNDSLKLLIDGQSIMEYNNLHTGLPSHYTPSVFLGAGEHTLELLSANVNTGTADGFCDISLFMRTPEEGICQLVDDSFLYQVVDRPDPHVVGF